MTLNEQIAVNISVYMKFIDMTNKQLAEQTGIDEATICKILKNGQHLTIPSLEKIAKALMVTVSDLTRTSEQDVFVRFSPEDLVSFLSCLSEINEIYEGYCSYQQENKIPMGDLMIARGTFSNLYRFCSKVIDICKPYAE